MTFAILTSLFISYASAQESLEQELESLPSTPPPAASPPVPAPTNRTKNKIKRVAPTAPPPAAPPKQRYIYSPVSIAKMRFAEANRDFGIMTFDLGLKIPGQFYVYSRNNMRSTAASRNRTDLLNFNSTTFLVSPQIYGFGFTSCWASSPTVNANNTRGGPYFRILERFESMSVIWVITYLLGDFKGESTRIFTLWNVSFLNDLFGFSGNANSSTYQKVWTANIDVDVTVKLYENLRLGIGYAKNRRQGSPDTDYALVGLELKNTF